tara:strand:+ start:7564 stop:8301 length:738 start_codon:yes stop_codon:yes gene_type:complete
MTSKTKERIERERDFHNEVFSNETRKAIKKYYKSTAQAKEYFQSEINKDIKNKKVLEFGCGIGSAVYSAASKGGKATGIDISEVAINKSKDHAKSLDLDINFQVMDAENLTFQDNNFDVVCGSGVLHHLDLEKSYSEITRVLRNNGKAVFIEPLGHNPIINLYRYLTPKMRTEDEHPLLMSDISMAQNYFGRIDIKYFNLFSTISTFIPALSSTLNKFDDFIFKNLPYLRKYSWIVVLTFKNPIK